MPIGVENCAPALRGRLRPPHDQRKLWYHQKQKNIFTAGFFPACPNTVLCWAVLSVLFGVIALVASQLQVVTVTDSHGKRATVVSAEREVVELIAQSGISPSGTEDELLVTETGENNSIHILRAFTVPVAVDGGTSDIVTTGGTVEEVLAESGIALGSDDETEPARDAAVQEGDSITVHRVNYDTYTVQEVVPAETVQVYTSLLLPSERLLPGSPAGLRRSGRSDLPR